MSFFDAIGDAVSGAVNAVGDAVSGAADVVGDAVGAAGDAAKFVGGAIEDGAGFVGDALGTGLDIVGEAADFAKDSAERFGKKVVDGIVDTYESATESPLGFLKTAGLTLLTLPLGVLTTYYKAGESVVEEAQERNYI